MTEFADTNDLTVPNMARWLAPWPVDAADLHNSVGLPDLQQDLTRIARRTVADITHLPSAVADLFAMSSHANLGAALATVGPHGHTIGSALTPEWAAVVAQVAGTSVAAATHLPEPVGGTDSVADLIAAAQAIHRIPDQHGTAATADKPIPGRVKPGDDDPVDVVAPTGNQDRLLDALLSTAQQVRELLDRAPSPWDIKDDGVLKVAVLVPYLTCLTTADVALSAAGGAMSGAAATTAARMLIEQAARLQWQGLGGGDAELWDRYVAVADRATQGRQLLRQRLSEAGTDNAALRLLFDPATLAARGAADRRRTPANTRAPRAPRPGELLADLGVGWAEPQWFEFAFSLLSQVVHATPLGDLHLVGRRLPSDNRTLSHEMTALAIDCACLGVATVAPRLAAVINLQADMPGHEEWERQLLDAAARVHSIARLLHFLD